MDTVTSIIVFIHKSYCSDLFVFIISSTQWSKKIQTLTNISKPNFISAFECFLYVYSDIFYKTCFEIYYQIGLFLEKRRVMKSQDLIVSLSRTNKFVQDPDFVGWFMYKNRLHHIFKRRVCKQDPCFSLPFTQNPVYQLKTSKIFQKASKTKTKF